MGQHDIVEWLKQRRLANDDRWYSCHDIAIGMNGNARAVQRSLVVIFGWRDIESKTIRRPWYNPKRVYRYRLIK